MFERDLSAKFRAYCYQHQYEVTIDRLITYLIDKGLIAEPAIRRFVIQHEFDREYPKNAQHKTKTIQLLADRLHLSERTIWSALRQR